MTHFDVVVIGAGAAGIFAAMRAGSRGRRVLLLEHGEEPGRKILISGGGRCNFTNLGCAPERFLSANPHFARSALARYTQHDFIALVRRHRIAFHEKTLGQLFCDGPARQIVRMLLAECEAAGVDLRLAHRVTEVTRADRFASATDHGAFTAESLVLATGGLSIPKMGATGFANDIARRSGLPVVTPRPALVPLTFADEELDLMRPLAGVALPVVARCGRAAFPEAMLFTPSRPVGPGDPAALLLLAGGRGDHRRPRPRPRSGRSTARGQARAAQGRGARRAGGDAAAAPRPGARRAAPAGAHARRDRRRAAPGARRAARRLAPPSRRHRGSRQGRGHAGRRGHRRAVAEDMGAKAVPGLFVIGEAVDVTGWLGGYKFQWAWSRGWAAGEAA